jgi:hypothetical protein
MNRRRGSCQKQLSYTTSRDELNPIMIKIRKARFPDQHKPTNPNPTPLQIRQLSMPNKFYMLKRFSLS